MDVIGLGKDIAQLIRLPNLWIIVIIQGIIQYGYLIPNSNNDSGSLFSNLYFWLLVLCTIIIGAGGYLINDFYDMQADTLNDRSGPLIDGRWERKYLLWGYMVLNFIGLGIAYVIARATDHEQWIFIYPAAVALLWLYSWRLKRRPIIGNLVVAVYCTFVPGVVLFAQSLWLDSWQSLDSFTYHLNMFILLGYLVFAFLSTWIREIVKDMEDIEGDRKVGHTTLPVWLGVKTTGHFVLILEVITLFLCLYWFYKLDIAKGYQIWTSFVSLLILPLMYIIRKSWTATQKSQFHHISTSIKLWMACGLFFLWMLSFAV